MASLCPQFEVEKITVAEDDEEGHPDPREILFVVDTNQSEMEEVKDILSAALNRLDMQVCEGVKSLF